MTASSNQTGVKNVSSNMYQREGINHFINILPVVNISFGNVILLTVHCLSTPLLSFKNVEHEIKELLFHATHVGKDLEKSDDGTCEKM